jgi:hypothetical protein
MAGLSHYWQATTSPPSYSSAVVPPLGPGGDSYYDDNEWVGIELVRAYELMPEPELLSQAQQIMNFVMAGWQSQPEVPCSGGVPFSTASNNTDRNTITDAPAAELGVLLYQLTGAGAYLQFAEQAYGWVRQCMLEAGNLYADHIETSGTIDRSLWSYNQGVMVGAGALLYQATYDGSYLSEARQTAAAALAHFTLRRLETEIPFFVSIYLRNLLYLDSVTHDPSGPKLAQEYVNHAWQHRAGGVFLFGSPPGADLLGQAAIAQVYGLLSTSPKTYF